MPRPRKRYAISRCASSRQSSASSSIPRGPAPRKMPRRSSTRSSRCGSKRPRSSASSRNRRAVMTRVAVCGIRSVAIDVCGLDEAASFYTTVWRLDEVATTPGARYFRGTGAYHHILSLHEAARPAVRRVVLDAAERDLVHELHARVKASGVATEAPHEWHAPGGGYGFGFQDAEG